MSDLKGRIAGILAVTALLAACGQEPGRIAVGGPHGAAVLDRVPIVLIMTGAGIWLKAPASLESELPGSRLRPGHPACNWSPTASGDLWRGITSATADATPCGIGTVPSTRRGRLRSTRPERKGLTAWPFWACPIAGPPWRSGPCSRTSASLASWPWASGRRSSTLTSLTICSSHNAYLDHPGVLTRVVGFLLQQDPTVSGSSG